MAQFSRIEVAQIMKETGMVPLFYHPDVELGKKVLKACYDGGARLLNLLLVEILLTKFLLN